MKVLLVVLAVFLLTACEKPKIEGVNKVGEVDLGFFAMTALLTEVCLDNTPYYLLINRARAGKVGNKSGLAVRYKPDGSIPPCSTSLSELPGPMQVNRIGVTRPDRNVGLVCIDGVSYIYVDEQFSAGLAVHRKARGDIVTCAPDPS